MSDATGVNVELDQLIKQTESEKTSGLIAQVIMDSLGDHAKVFPEILSLAQEFRKLSLSKLDESTLNSMTEQAANLRSQLVRFWTESPSERWAGSVFQQEVVDRYRKLSQFRVWIPYLTMEELRGSGGLFEKINEQLGAGVKKITDTVAVADKVIADARETFDDAQPAAQSK